MRHTKDRGHSEESGVSGVQSESDLVQRFSDALLQFQGPDAPDRMYKAAVENTSKAAKEAVSLWRLGDEGPSLVAFRGADETPAEELLSAMKRRVSDIWEQSEGRIPRAKRRPGGEEDRRDGLAVANVWMSGRLWGALVHSCSGRGNCCAFADSMAVAMGLVAERQDLHEEIGSLRGKLALEEKDKDATDKYMAIGRLAVHSYKELEAILDSVASVLRRRAFAGRPTDVDQCLAELERGLAIVLEQLELANLEMPVLKMADLNELVQESMRQEEDRIHSKGLRLMKRLATGLPKLLLDAEKVKVAIEKALNAAASRSVPEGWLKVESVLQDGQVILQVTWEEKNSPGGGCDDMFVPFGPLDKGGVGLVIALQIIREHGGGVRIKRYESGSSALILDFPVQSNQDRRRKSGRRSGVDRRRFTG